MRRVQLHSGASRNGRESELLAERSIGRKKDERRLAEAREDEEDEEHETEKEKKSFRGSRSQKKAKRLSPGTQPQRLPSRDPYTQNCTLIVRRADRLSTQASLSSARL